MPDTAQVDAVVLAIVTVIRLAFIAAVLPWIACQLIALIGGAK